MNEVHAAFKKQVVTAAINALYACRKIHVSVVVNEKCRVPMNYVNNGVITLNISPEAVSNLVLGDDVILFNARFNGEIQLCSFPYVQVISVGEPNSANAVNLPYVVTEKPYETKVDKIEPKADDKKERPKLSVVKKD